MVGTHKGGGPSTPSILNDSDERANDGGTIKQIVNEQQQPSLFEQYLDNLAASALELAFSNSNRKMSTHNVSVETTNSATLTQQAQDEKEVLDETATIGMAANEQDDLSIQFERSLKIAVTPPMGDHCYQINTQNITLPQGLYKGLSNNLEEAPTICNHAPLENDMDRNDANEAPISPFRKVPMIGRKALSPESEDIKVYFNFWKYLGGLSFRQAAIDAIKIRKSVYLDQKIVHKAMECQKYKEKTYRYYEALKQSRIIDEDCNNEWHDLPYPAISPEEMKSLEMEVKGEDKDRALSKLQHEISQRSPLWLVKCDDYDIRILFPVLKSPVIPQPDIVTRELPAVFIDTSRPIVDIDSYCTLMPVSELEEIWQTFEETGYLEPLPAFHEPDMEISYLIEEGHPCDMGQSENESARHRISLEEKAWLENRHQGLGIRDSAVLLDALPPLSQDSPSKLSSSSEFDIFEDCEEEILLIRTTPLRLVEERRSWNDTDREKIQDQRDIGSFCVDPRLVYDSPRISDDSPQNVRLIEDAAELIYGFTKTCQNDQRLTTAGHERLSSGMQGVDILLGEVSNVELLSTVSVKGATPIDLTSELGSSPVSQHMPFQLTISSGIKCPNCGKIYKYKGPFNTHRQVCHPQDGPNESPMDAQVFPCQRCGKRFKRMGYYENHLASCNARHKAPWDAPISEMKSELEKQSERLVPFPRDDAINSLGRPVCEACKAQFITKEKLVKHIKASCTELRKQGSYSKVLKRKFETPQDLSFEEPLLSSNFGSETESKSSTFAATMGNNGNTSVRQTRQATKKESSESGYSLRRRSSTELLNLIYRPQAIKQSDPQSKTFAHNLRSSNISSYTMTDPSLDSYLAQNKTGNGVFSDADVSPAPKPKKRKMQKQQRNSLILRSSKPSDLLAFSPDSETTSDDDSSKPVSRVLTFEPGLLELQGTKPIRRKLFPGAYGTNVILPNTKSNVSSQKAHNQQACEKFDADFPPLPVRPAATTFNERVTKGSRSYSYPEIPKLEVFTIHFMNRDVCARVVKLLSKFKHDNQPNPTFLILNQQQVTLHMRVFPGFDITAVRFDQLPGTFMRRRGQYINFVQTEEEISYRAVENTVEEKQEPEIEKPSAKTRRGWNLRSENRHRSVPSVRRRRSHRH